MLGKAVARRVREAETTRDIRASTSDLRVSRPPPQGRRLAPTLIINPADDAVFVAYVRAVMRDGVLSPDALNRLLSRNYPRVVVRRRELSNEPIEVWYVYRDGHWTPPPRRSDKD